ncbi:uncharacterized protein LOC122576841 [Bombus pyrosoma]|uniref:uncharacterized protein LOC122576841 n=1 Tax=Bombus pyrosoma TaxID=396416 RepID=UPI001CB91ACF|nr:uncharacterized protein LOC122576841 [Bombus pyrosoma]XP_043603614.1 uncharacterized protein LOC122576841 [Bombus pyrosoma]XP_043603615.1 uncharacterized protein LOC122576841 [Bombus pyrosoma]
MAKKCIICKTEATPISKAKRSFHMFPKNELIRKKWMDAINLLEIPNFKTACICSDHFDDKSFHDSDELRSRKRLRPEAVPQRISFKKSDDTSKEKDLGSEKLFERPVDKDSSKSEIKVINEQDCSTAGKSNSSVDNVPNSGNRRKHSLIKKIPKRIRFMNGFKTEHITREDFVSDEAWNRFLRLITYERNRMAAAHNRNSRKEKKIKNFKLLIKGLENHEELDATQYVKVILK